MGKSAAMSGQACRTRSWRDRCLAIRDRFLTSPEFRRWAVTFPLTRPIARRRARDLFDLCAGFVYSQVLLAGVRLGLFDILAEGPQTVADLSARMALPAGATSRLMEAATALRLAEARGPDRYGLGALGAAMLGNPGVAAMVEHHAVLYADLRDPVALLRGGATETGLGRYWPYGAAAADMLGRDAVAPYSTLMSASQPLIAAEILDAYPVRRHRCLLDVGGGDGTFLALAAARAPSLRLILFDLPAVANLARANFAARGLTACATAVGGNFLTDPLPAGADLVSLVRVIHDHDDGGALTILRAVARALAPGGVLLLAEPMAATPGAEMIGAYFAFYLLAVGRGRPRTAAALQGLLHAAGFGHVEMLANRTPLLCQVALARADRRG